MTKLADVDFASSTALISGGSSGIGRAIAFELVSRGVARLVVTGRNEERLSATAEELKKAGNTEVRTIINDLSKQQGDDEGPAAIQKQIADWGWTVDILVNNAGSANVGPFAKDPKAGPQWLEQVDVMFRGVVDMTLRFLPGMVQRGSGGVLNIGSTAWCAALGRGARLTVSSYQPVPFTAVYAASKAAVNSFSQALREENRDTGVRIAQIVPGITETQLDGEGLGERRGTLDIVGRHKAEDVAVQAVDAYIANAAEQVVGLGNKVLRAGVQLVPSAVTAAVVAKSRAGLVPRSSKDDVPSSSNSMPAGVTLHSRRVCELTIEAASIVDLLACPLTPHRVMIALSLAVTPSRGLCGQAWATMSVAPARRCGNDRRPMTAPAHAWLPVPLLRVSARPKFCSHHPRDARVLGRHGQPRSARPAAARARDGASRLH